MKLDAPDLMIRDELQADASLSSVELARRAQLSPSPCLARSHALELRGPILHYLALLDARQLGRHLNLVITISLRQRSCEALPAFEDRLCVREEVVACDPMTGDANWLSGVAVAEIRALERIYLEQLSPIAQVEQIRASLALTQVRFETALPRG